MSFGQQYLKHVLYFGIINLKKCLLICSFTFEKQGFHFILFILEEHKVPVRCEMWSNRARVVLFRWWCCQSKIMSRNSYGWLNVVFTRSSTVCSLLNFPWSLQSSSTVLRRVFWDESLVGHLGTMVVALPPRLWVIALCADEILFNGFCGTKPY